MGGLFPESNRIQDIIRYVELDCGYNVMFLVGYNYQWFFFSTEINITSNGYFQQRCRWSGAGPMIESPPAVG